MIRRKPHTLVVSVAAPNIDPETKVRKNVAYTGSVSVKGLLQPDQATRIFDDYGVKTTRPHLFMFDPEDADKITLGAELTMGERKFVSASPTLLQVGQGGADYAAVILDETQYARP